MIKSLLWLIIAACLFGTKAAAYANEPTLTCQEWRDSSDKKTDYLITKLGFARGIDVAVSIDKAGKTLRDAWVLLQGSNDR